MSEFDSIDEQDGGAQTIESGSEESKGSLLLGLGVGIGLTIVLELIVGLALNAQTNLVHRYVAYLLGLLPLIIAAILTRSGLKMAFIGAPAIIISSFALPFFLPNIFTGLMTPFLTLLPIISEMLKQLTGLGVVSEGQLQQFRNLQQFAIVFDFVVAFIVGIIAAIGVSGLTNLVTKEANASRAIIGFFSLFFFLIGVIILPYAIVILSGISHFGLAMSTGGLVLNQGLNEATNENGSLSLANEYFSNSTDWFTQAEDMLTGLQQLGLFSIASQISQDIDVIINNGLKLVSAGVDLAQGIAPAMGGVAAIQRGMTQAMDVIQPSGSSSLALTQNDENTTKFLNAIDLIERGFDNFTDSKTEINEALEDVSEMQTEELNQALQNQGLGDQSSNINLVTDGTNLLNLTLDVFSNEEGTGIIDDPDGIDNDDQRAPIVHLLLGAFAMSQAQDKIGDNTNFQGTGFLFKNVVSNISIVVNALDEDQNKGFARLSDADFSGSDSIVEFQNKLVGTFNFLRDAGNTTISIGNFGIKASPSLESMNKSLTLFDPTKSGYDNFTAIPQSEYDTTINNFERTPNGIIANATSMKNQATSAKTKIANLRSNSNNGSYGFLNSQAKQFAGEFEAFNLTQNANNFFFLSQAYNSVLKTAKVLASTDTNIKHIETNAEIIQSEINEGTFSGNENVTIVNALDNTKGNVTVANTTLDQAHLNINFAANNFSQVQNMPQLDGTEESFRGIANKTRDIQVGNTTLADFGGSTPLDANTTQGQFMGLTHVYYLVNVTGSDANEKLADFLTNPSGDERLEFLIDELDFINTQFIQIQTDLANINIAS